MREKYQQYSEIWFSIFADFSHGQHNLKLSEVLLVERSAKEEDLEEVGDTIWQTVLEIYCCPFCGESLSNSKEQVVSADIAHYDN